MLAKEWLKRKGLTQDALQPLIIPAIVILVGISAFALGRLSAAVGPAASTNSASIGQ
jgi:hypothetical protein